MPIYIDHTGGCSGDARPETNRPEDPQATMPHKLRHLHVAKRSRVRFQGVHAPVRLHLEVVPEDTERGQHLAARSPALRTAHAVRVGTFAPGKQRRRRRRGRSRIQRDRNLFRLVLMSTCSNLPGSCDTNKAGKTANWSRNSSVCYVISSNLQSIFLQ